MFDEILALFGRMVVSMEKHNELLEKQGTDMLTLQNQLLKAIPKPLPEIDLLRLMEPCPNSHEADAPSEPQKPEEQKAKRQRKLANSVVTVPVSDTPEPVIDAAYVKSVMIRLQDAKGYIVVKEVLARNGVTTGKLVDLKPAAYKAAVQEAEMLIAEKGDDVFAEAEAPVAPPETTEQEVRDSLIALAKAKGTAVATAILIDNFKVSKVVDLKKESYDLCIAKCKVALRPQTEEPTGDIF